MTIRWQQQAALLGLLLSAAMPLAAAAANSGESGPASLQSRVRAAFLFNFARFTEWPPREAGAQGFDFCLVENADLERALIDTLRGKQIDGQRASVRRLERGDDATGCRLLYLPALSQQARDHWLQAVSQQAVLTISEGRDFAREGGMIGLFLADRRLRFSINPQVVHAAGMQMSSRLLGLADIAGGER